MCIFFKLIKGNMLIRHFAYFHFFNSFIKSYYYSANIFYFYTWFISAISGNNLYIKKGCVAIYSKKNTPIYTNPNREAKITQFIHNPILLKVVEYKNGWMKVKNVGNRECKISGWLPPENQCPDQWTPC